MRKIILLIGGVFFTSLLNAQVGIGTNEPEASLDVSGDVRIKTTLAGTNEATKDSILAVDGFGFVKRVSAAQVYTQIVDSIQKNINNNTPGSFVKANFSVNGSSLINISLFANSWSKIPFNQESFDVNNDFDTGGNTFTAPKDGIYNISAQFKLNTLLNVGQIGVGVLKSPNGGGATEVMAREIYTSVSLLGVNVSPPTRKVNVLVKLNAGDQIYAGIYTTVNVSVGLISYNADSYLSIHQVK